MTIITTLENLIATLEHLITTAEKFKSAYFWNSPCTAHERRAYEEYYSIPEFEWDENGNHFTAELSISCSCKNVYAKGIYTRNGDKTTLTAIKNSLKRLKASETTYTLL